MCRVFFLLCRPGWITAAENFFVVIFVGEYFLRLRADTWVWMFEPMNMFDTFVDSWLQLKVVQVTKQASVKHVLGLLSYQECIGLGGH